MSVLCSPRPLYHSLSAAPTPRTQRRETTCEDDSPCSTARPVSARARRSTVSLQPGRHVVFFANGDRFFKGKRLFVVSHKYATFSDLLTEVTERLIAAEACLPYGARQLFSLDGRRVRSVQELREDAEYVCAGFERFRSMRYGSALDATPRLSRVRPGSAPAPAAVRAGTLSMFTFALVGASPPLLRKLYTSRVAVPSFPILLREVRLLFGEEGEQISRLMTIKGLEVHTVGDLFRTDTHFLALPARGEVIIAELEVILTAIFPLNSVLVKQTLNHWQRIVSAKPRLSQSQVLRRNSTRLRTSRQSSASSNSSNIPYQTFSSSESPVKSARNTNEQKQRNRPRSGLYQSLDEQLDPVHEAVTVDRSEHSEAAASAEKTPLQDSAAPCSGDTSSVASSSDSTPRLYHEPPLDRVASGEQDEAENGTESAEPELDLPLHVSVTERDVTPVSSSPSDTQVPKFLDREVPSPNSTPKMQTNPAPVKRRCSTKTIPTSMEAMYTLGPVLGDGNFAVVRHSRCLSSHDESAMKIIDKSRLKSHFVETEVRLMSACNHDNVVKLFCSYEDVTHQYLVMELVRGGDLFEALKDAPTHKFDEPTSAGFVRDIASALVYLHCRSLVHRDLKPENLMLQPQSDGSRGQLKLGDFGLAAEIEDGRPLFTVCGTPTYVAPEMIDQEGYGVEVDCWSAGIISYILLVGFPPFRCRKDDKKELFRRIQKGAFTFPSPYWDKISASAKDLLSQVLVVDARDRFTAMDFLAHPWLLSDGGRLPLPTSPEAVDELRSQRLDELEEESIRGKREWDKLKLLNEV